MLLRSAEGKPSFASISPMQRASAAGPAWGGSRRWSRGGAAPPRPSSGSLAGRGCRVGRLDLAVPVQGRRATLERAGRWRLAVWGGQYRVGRLDFAVPVRLQGGYRVLLRELVEWPAGRRRRAGSWMGPGGPMGPGAGRWRRLPDPWGRPPGVGSGGGRRVVKSRRAVSGRGAAVAWLLGGVGGRSGGLPWSS